MASPGADFWDPPPPCQPAWSSKRELVHRTVSATDLDDRRDHPERPDHRGWLSLQVCSLQFRTSLGTLGRRTRASTTVTDNDAAQELELNFGKDGVNDADVNEANSDKLAFVVKRRQQDADTAIQRRFTVRVETDRSGDDWRLEDWTEDTGTGRLYKDYALQLTGSDLEVKEELAVTLQRRGKNPTWSYWASIRPIEDHAGNQLTSSEEAQYWTVKSGFRETTVDATDSGASNGIITIDADVTTVTEGESILFTLYRVDGPMSKPVTARVQTSETKPPGRLWGQPQHRVPQRDHRGLGGRRRIHRLSLRGRGRRDRR